MTTAPPEITERALTDLYRRQGLSLSEIAARFGCTRANIAYYVKKWGIEPPALRWDGLAIKQLLKARGWTHAQLADAVSEPGRPKITVSTVSRWVNDESAPNKRAVRRLNALSAGTGGRR